MESEDDFEGHLYRECPRCGADILPTDSWVIDETGSEFDGQMCHTDCILEGVGKNM